MSVSASVPRRNEVKRMRVDRPTSYGRRLTRRRLRGRNPRAFFLSDARKSNLSNLSMHGGKGRCTELYLDVRNIPVDQSIRSV